MRAREVMTSPAITIQEDAPVKDAAKLIEDARINGAPVLDASGTLVGMVTEADLLRLEIRQEPATRIWPHDRGSAARVVRDVMTRDVVAIPSSTDLPFLAEFMLKHHLKSVPVVEDGKVVGVVARRDIVKLFAFSDVALERQVRAVLDDEIEFLGRFDVEVRDGVVKLSGRADRPTRRLVERLVRSTAGVVDVDVSGIAVRRRATIP